MTKPTKNVLEWSVFAASSVIVLATVAYLVWSAVEREHRPPDLHVYTGAAIPNTRRDFWRIPIVVRNVGDTTAEEVAVELVLEKAGRDVETATVAIAFVPRHSEREGWATFRQDPRCCTLRARAAGYAEP